MFIRPRFLLLNRCMPCVFSQQTFNELKQVMMRPAAGSDIETTIENGKQIGPTMDGGWWMGSRLEVSGCSLCFCGLWYFNLTIILPCSTVMSCWRWLLLLLTYDARACILHLPCAFVMRPGGGDATKATKKRTDQKKLVYENCFCVMRHDFDMR